MSIKYSRYRNMLVEVVRDNPGLVSIEIHDMVKRLRGCNGKLYRNVPTQRAIFFLLNNTACLESEGVAPNISWYFKGEAHA